MTYWLRLMGSVVVGLMLVVFLSETSASKKGDSIFMALHSAMFVTIWLLVPTLTADCIARERREGTLGLLFLTPLRAREIVFGKSLVHMLRGVTLVIAAWPILSVPLLMGGVSSLDVYSAFCFQFSAIALCLAAGVMASSFGKIWTRTLLLAFVFAFLLAAIYSVILIAGWAGTAGGGWKRSLTDWEFWLQQPIKMTTGFGRSWSKWLTGARAQHWWMLLAASMAVSVLLLALSVFFAGVRLQRSWQDESPGKRQMWWLRTFCTPRFLKTLFRRKMTRALDKNPIRWLQQYSWSARLGKWGWCLAVIIAECLVLLTGSQKDFYIAQVFVGLSLFVGLAFIAAGSFRIERENGALELLLVTPLREGQIIFGRLQGVWAQMLPAIGIAALSMAGAADMYKDPSSFGVFLLFGSTILVMPMIGLALSLRLRNFLGAWMATLSLGFLIPYFGIALLYFILHKLRIRLLDDFNVAVRFMVLVQWCAFAVCARTLYHNLKRRRFALNAG